MSADRRSLERPMNPTGVFISSSSPSIDTQSVLRQHLSESPEVISVFRPAVRMPQAGSSTSLARSTIGHRSVNRPARSSPSLVQGVKAISSWLNLLLVFVPLSWAAHFAGWNNTVTFIFAFLGIVPLARLLCFATEELSLHLGQTLGGLLNATFGNAVELIVAVIALIRCELRIVQSSLIGSILSNLLLVLGMSFFAGGLKYSEQSFAISTTQLNTSLLTLSVIFVLLPVAFYTAIPSEMSIKEGRDILVISRGVAVILLVIYVCYLIFQLFSHNERCAEDSQNVAHPVEYRRRQKRTPAGGPVAQQDGQQAIRGLDVPRDQDGSDSDSVSWIGSAHSQDIEVGPGQPDANREPEEEEVQSLSVRFALILLLITSAVVAVTSVFLIDTIDELTSSGTISKQFVGLILLPIVGNAAEHITAVSVAVKAKLTLSLGVAIGSGIQISFLVIPSVVLLGWALGKPLTLLFDPFESIALFLAVLTVNYVLQDGRSNWLKGVILMCLYAVCAIVFWFYPGTDPAGTLAHCT